ncbi:MAG: glycosyltransferase family 25 protein, partial [Spongiibacteraceae bacterium]
MSTDELTLCCRVVSLHPQAENTGVLMGALAEQGVDASIYAAVDGRKSMPTLESGERFNRVLSMLRHKKVLTSGELGCYLSHLRAVREAYQAGYEFVCVIEDDVVIEKDFASVLQALTKRSDLDMVRLMALRLRQRKVLGEIADTGHQLTRPVRGAVGTQAYLMNRVGMKKFLDYAQTIYEPVDKVFDHFWLFDLHVYGVEPHTVYELEHETSIAKKAAVSVSGPSVLERLLFHPVKLWFSLRRHSYRLRNHR